MCQAFYDIKEWLSVQSTANLILLKSAQLIKERKPLLPPQSNSYKCVGLARTIHIRCIYGIFGREVTNYTVINSVYIRFWPTL